MGGGAKLAKFLLIGAASLALAWPAYDFALFSTLRVANPEVALRLSPSDSVALAKVVSLRIKEEQRYDADPDDTRAALRSLSATPLSRSSLRIVGMNAGLAGDSDRAAAAMGLSSRVSRRDTLAQAWLLERSLERNDFEAALQHYHAALSVRPELDQVLNPVLVTTVQYPEIRTAIRPYLVSNARWAPSFLNRASEDADATTLFEMISPVARWLGSEPYYHSMGRIAYRLAADGKWDDAMELAETTWGDFSAQEFAALPPSRITTDKRLGRLAWALTTGQGINARVNQDGTMDVSMDPLSRGTIAVREVAVAGGGQYSFIQRVKFFGSGEMARINWRAECVSSADEKSRPVWKQTVPSRSDAMTYRSAINVPVDCNLLSLTLSGTGPESQRQSTFRIMQVEFAKAAK